MTNSSSPKPGRPSLLTERMINRIAKAVQAGKTREEAAAQVAISLGTLRRWITLGRRARENGGAATGGLEEMALRLVVALEVAERKRRAAGVILSGGEPGKEVSVGSKALGRPSLLTQEVLEVVLPLCAEGKIGEAAKEAGVDRRTVHRWIARGQSVRAAGGQRSEYERMCGVLHAAVEAASGLGPVASASGSAPVIAVGRPRRRTLLGLVAARLGFR